MKDAKLEEKPPENIHYCKTLHIFTFFLFFVNYFCQRRSGASQPKSMQIRIHSTVLFPMQLLYELNYEYPPVRDPYSEDGSGCTTLLQVLT
jgi:hypothetical protein